MGQPERKTLCQTDETNTKRGSSFRNLPPSHTTIVEYLELFKVAPHVNTCVKSDLTSDHPILNRAIKGDFFRFMKNVGGGGGHCLTIKNFLASISIVYKSK